MVVLLAVWMYMMPMETIIPVEMGFDSVTQCTEELHRLNYTVIQESVLQSVFESGYDDLDLVCYNPGRVEV